MSLAKFKTHQISKYFDFSTASFTRPARQFSKKSGTWNFFPDYMKIFKFDPELFKSFQVFMACDVFFLVVCQSGTFLQKLEISNKKPGQNFKIRDKLYLIRKTGQILNIRDCPGKLVADGRPIQYQSSKCYTYI